MTGRLPIRNDDIGNGAFGSPRTKNGSHYKHNGIDYACVAGTEIESPVEGVVHKHGIPYVDDKTLKLIVLKDREGYEHTYMYVEPVIRVGTNIKKGDVIGISQDMSHRYPSTPFKKFQNHVHRQISLGSTIINPNKWRENERK